MYFNEKVIDLIERFIERCDNILFEKNAAYINSAELYYKSQVFVELIGLMEESNTTVSLKHKIETVTETILELYK